MVTKSPRRRSAGKINALRRWDPAADEVVAHDVDTICAIASRIARPLTAAEHSRILAALRPADTSRAPIAS